MNLFDLAAKLTLDSSQYEKGLADAEKKGSGFGGKLKTAMNVGAAAVTAATGAITAFAGSSVKAGRDFDSSMSQVAATMGTTVDQIQELREFAQKMGSTTAFSATQAADALNYMALAGYDAQTSMDMLPNVLNLAAAGGMELADASDMITDASSALGLSLDETAQMVDKMAKASSKSNTSVSQLGSAILTVGGTAKSLAGGTTELSTALGILGDNGIKGAEGGTALRNMILALATPTDKAAKTLKSLGVEALDANGNLRPLEDVFGDLNAAMDGMSEGHKTQFLSDIFNKVDLKSANALLATTSDRWNELSASIDDAQGAASAMAETQLDNLNGDITLFKSALEGAQIALSDKLAPSLRTFVQFGSDGLSRLTEAFNAGGVSGAMNELGSILSDGVAMIVEQLPDWINAGMQLIGSLTEGIIQNLPLIAETGLELLVNLANGIAENLPTLIPTIVDVVLQIVDTLTQPNTLSALIDASIAIIFALADGLIDALPKLLERAPEIVQNLVDAIVRNAPKLLAAAWELIKKLAEGIVKNLPTLLAKGKEIVSKVISGIGQAISGLWDAGMNIVRGIWQGISNGLGWIKDRISGWVGDLLGFFKRILKISSPSKVFADQIGRFLGLGIGQGFVDVMPVVEDMMASAMPDPAGLVGPLDFRVSGGARGRTDYELLALLYELLALLRDIRDNMDTDLVLSDGTLIGWMDKALGRKAMQRARGNA